MNYGVVFTSAMVLSAFSKYAETNNKRMKKNLNQKPSEIPVG